VWGKVAVTPSQPTADPASFRRGGFIVYSAEDSEPIREGMSEDVVRGELAG